MILIYIKVILAKMTYYSNLLTLYFSDMCIKTTPSLRNKCKVSNKVSKLQCLLQVSSKGLLEKCQAKIYFTTGVVDHLVIVVQ